MKAKQTSSRRMLPPDEIASFCGQISLILQAGIPLYDGMETLVESCEDKEAKEAFKQLAADVVETGMLYEAVKNAGFFPKYMVNMIHIGEESGKLDEVLRALNAYYEREAKIKKSIKSAITYPILLVVMMAAVIALLVTNVLPIFEKVFNNMGTEISNTGKSIMNAGMLVGNIAFVITGIVLVLILAIYIANALGYGEALKRLSFKLPLLRGLSKKMSAGRFASVLSMMISSGYSLEKALELAPGIVTDVAARDKIEKCGNLLKEGKSFTEALEEIKMFDGMQNRMINVGFKAGQLDAVMDKMTKIYEDEVDSSIEKLLSYIEPTLVAILSIIIGGILVSVMLPLTSIMSSIG
ncbi:MAG: type II secretion system F family protein [Lachnospiraceae bacterium]|nr:type II secretion system F family protein [Lachnospiraceae bacterium]